MELEITIEKMDDSIELPLSYDNGFQMREDGIFLNGKLHLWEQILCVHIWNKKLLKELMEKRLE